VAIYSDRMKTKPGVTVIGAGALGSALLRSLGKSGYLIQSVISRNPGAELLEFESGETEFIQLNEAENMNIGSLVFIASPDDSIRDVANVLSTSNVKWPGRTVAHCSGFLTSDELVSIREVGGSVASFHPLQTFTKSSFSESFKNINISLEGDPDAVELLRKVIIDLEAHVLFLDQNQKSMLHISAVFLSNYVVALGSIAERLIQKSIPGKDLSLLHPLLIQSVSNLAQSNPARALTGPVSRGDVQTVSKHLEMLNQDSDMLKAYKLLGAEAIRIVENNGTVQGDSLSDLKKLLRNE